MGVRDSIGPNVQNDNFLREIIRINGDLFFISMTAFGGDQLSGITHIYALGEDGLSGKGNWSSHKYNLPHPPEGE